MRENSRSAVGTAAGLALMIVRSRTVRPRKTRGVANATCTREKSGSVRSRDTESTTCPRGPSTTIRSCTCPGGASNCTDPPGPDGAAAAAVPPDGAAGRRRGRGGSLLRHAAFVELLAVRRARGQHDACGLRLLRWRAWRRTDRLPAERDAGHAALAARRADPEPGRTAALRLRDGVQRGADRGRRFRLRRRRGARRFGGREAPSSPCAPARPGHAGSPGP